MLSLLRNVLQNFKTWQAFATHIFLVLFAGLTFLHLLVFTFQNKSPFWIIFGVYATATTLCIVNLLLSQKFKKRFFRWRFAKDQMINVFAPPISLVLMSTSLSFVLFSFIDPGVKETWNEGLLVTREAQEIVMQYIVTILFLLEIFFFIPVNIYNSLMRETHISRTKIELTAGVFLLGAIIFASAGGLQFLSSMEVFRMLAFVLIAGVAPIGWMNELLIGSIAKRHWENLQKSLSRKVPHGPVFD
ncbi:MAG: hypothetical protein A3E07_03505 [Candidatus Wildermuthbacteria bacterium RIFCSPHIGHO2_12_FULL_45_9]|uniref:Uncharacterized protein n=1 Tax=Candidatus Wildermuthbacteria bacterium RIFCSPHIGHO2_02_FULL_45_25 TaxID=1802450 RepID=A0A1G2R3D7_9BACT|nr:MAG: hypothetical protein A2748_00070 [Candidatus Wildermuthbacteria bacterium RIFCSPHIGHO2_01_FULL_45_20]OHA67303.1 MAG: hypothetical protein A3C04_01095 [Candidatus Wildermuthbacteria bacterium RIFCSPHIGHO2_02_FULL_45_25]OHA71123.1 MAG: hypothetical protein A3E07_03505 [Candidatus Wildermuthbacteria bacterium RIFCSPHIGHO2_12_FULL_45_9]